MGQLVKSGYATCLSLVLPTTKKMKIQPNVKTGFGNGRKKDQTTQKYGRRRGGRRRGKVGRWWWWWSSLTEGTRVSVPYHAFTSGVRLPNDCATPVHRPSGRAINDSTSAQQNGELRHPPSRLPRDETGLILAINLANPKKMPPMSSHEGLKEMPPVSFSNTFKEMPHI